MESHAFASQTLLVNPSHFLSLYILECLCSLWKDSPTGCSLPFGLHILVCIHRGIPPSCSTWTCYFPVWRLRVRQHLYALICYCSNFTSTSWRNWQSLSSGFKDSILCEAVRYVGVTVIFVSMPAGASIWAILTLNWESQSLTAIWADPLRVLEPSGIQSMKDSKDLVV